MDWQIALFLAQDGITNGVIYALLALALVLVFAVTRVIFIPQGEFVTYGTLTLAALQAGRIPGTLWLLVAAGTLVALMDGWAAARAGRRRLLFRSLVWNLGLPWCLVVASHYLQLAGLPLVMQAAFALAIVVPLGSMVYRLAFQPLAEASVLVLLIVAVAVHLTMVGLGLYFFGAEGSRTPAFADWSVTLGDFSVAGQTLCMIGASLVLGGGLYAFFERSLHGKALRATAINRRGAHLMGISSVTAGKWAFTLAAALGAFSGILIGPITTIYYDTGFLIGLKGFVGAIIGGLASYPLAAAGALLVGLLEAYSSFWASAFKEVIVFSLIIPVLLWRSLRGAPVHEEES
jgi:branched-subunit amino acid ABC-type transport system permease component